MFQHYIDNLKSVCDFEMPFKISQNDSNVERIEIKVKAKLPESFANIYKQFDGESQLLGLVAGFELLTADRVIAEYENLRKSGIEFEQVGTDAISEKPIAKNQWIPFAFDGSDCFIVLDLSPSKKGVAGQIIGLDMEDATAFAFANSMDEFFEKLAKLVEEGKIITETEQDAVCISEVSGHFFNGVNEYAMMNAAQNENVILEDEFWIKKFQKQVKEQDGYTVVSSSDIAKKVGSFRIMNDSQKLSCKPFEYMTNVKELVIHHSELRDFECIAKMKNLTTLYLIDCTIIESELAVLADAPKLKMLSFGDIKGKIDMKTLSKCKTLKRLSVSQNEGIDYSEIGYFKQLTELKIEGSYKGDYGFLTELSKLKVLKLYCEKVDNLDFLYKLNKLEEFEMYEAAKNEEGLQALKAMPKLKSFIYPVKDLLIYQGVTGINTAGFDYRNNGQYQVFEGTNLNSFTVFGDGSEDEEHGDEMMKQAERIAEELGKYGLRISSFGSIG